MFVIHNMFIHLVVSRENALIEINRKKDVKLPTYFFKGWPTVKSR
jgi:hypothetical protein